MNLAFLTPPLYSESDSNFWSIHNDPNVPASSSSPGRHDVYENSEALAVKEKERKEKRRRNRTSIKKKRTHLWHFNCRQKKCRRPRPVPDPFMSGPNMVRFGTFCGIRDSRSTRCPFRGIKHGIYINIRKRCACRSFTLYPSPLVYVVTFANPSDLSQSTSCELKFT